MAFFKVRFQNDIAFSFLFLMLKIINQIIFITTNEDKLQLAEGVFTPKPNG